MSHNYLMKYRFKIETGKFSKDEVKAEAAKDGTMGAADAFVFASIIRGNDTGEPHEGTKSIMVVSRDGRDPKGEQEVPSSELFQVAVQICRQVASDPEALEWQRVLAADLFEQVREIVLARRRAEEKDHA